MSYRSESSNLAKYQTRNPVARLLIARFFDRLSSMIEPLEADSALDAGCGEGEAIARLGAVLPEAVSAVDVDERAIRTVRERFPSVDVTAQSLYKLEFTDDAFDVVICLEVLEHLERPADAVRELARVARKHLLVSVPYEPFFRLGSALRGKHLHAWGNHPEHVNHWNRSRFHSVIEPHVESLEVGVAFPWLIAHCVARESAERSAAALS